MSIQLNQLSDAINKALTEYSDTVADSIDSIVDEVTKDMKKEIQANSPKKSGKYKRGWRITAVSSKRGNRKLVVHNKQYRLTHLLEYGHAKRNGGRVEGHSHIAPAEEKYTDIFLKKVEEVLNNET